MKLQYTLVGLFAVVLLVASPFGLVLSDDNLDSENGDSDETTILKSGEIPSNIGADLGFNTIMTPPTISTTTPPTEPLTTTTTPTSIAVGSASTPVAPSPTSPASTPVASSPTSPASTPVATSPTSSASTPVAISSTSILASPTSPISTPAPPSSTTSSTTAATQPATTAPPPGRKFDGLSFLGGMILVIGLGALAYVVVRYLRRTNRLPYSNLR